MLGWVGGSERIEGGPPTEEAVADRLDRVPRRVLRAFLRLLPGGKRIGRVLALTLGIWVPVAILAVICFFTWFNRSAWGIAFRAARWVPTAEPPSDILARNARTAGVSTAETCQQRMCS